MKTLFILGRQPAIGRAEIEALYSAPNVLENGSGVVLDKNPNDIEFERLGGSVKLAALFGEASPQELYEKIKNFMREVDIPVGRKINLGISFYNDTIKPSQINKINWQNKKILRSRGFNSRVVPNKSTELSSAQVLHNKLATTSGIELIVYKSDSQYILGRTLEVQDINAYSHRDQNRPKRDAKVGMLPPKLAQIIINLASGAIDPKGSTLLDPFCGTGVILQEALLMGFDVVGTDLEPRMIEYTDQNLGWLKNNYQLEKQNIKLETADAQNGKWPAGIKTIACETYLGRPLFKEPFEDELDEIINPVNSSIVKFLANLRDQIPANTRMCLAMPAWAYKNDFVHLPLLDHLTDLGYNRLDYKTANNKELIYHRPGQFVGRELVTLIKE